MPHALKFGESGTSRWLWISRRNRDDLFREAGVPTSEPEPREEDLDMERIVAIFEDNGMRFIEDRWLRGERDAYHVRVRHGSGYPTLIVLDGSGRSRDSREGIELGGGTSARQ